MPSRDIIVVGASAGGLEAIRTLIRGLPENLPATLFIVIHTSPEGPGLLSEILGKIAPLSVTTATDGERIVSGHIYVAPPDFHLTLGEGRIRLTRGPREHRFRPAVDPLFRSAAEQYGPRVIGIVMSGNLADGTHGLMVIKQRGGVAIVQDPHEAMVPAMPQSAVDRVKVDFVLSAAEMAPALEELTMKGVAPDSRAANRGRALKGPVAEHPVADALETKAFEGPPTPFTCPDCGGTLWESTNGDLARYRCHVGHGFTGESLIAAQDGKLEDILWSALRALEESLELRQRMAQRARASDLTTLLPRVEEDMADLRHRIEALRNVLLAVPGPRARRRTTRRGRSAARPRQRRARPNR